MLYVILLIHFTENSLSATESTYKVTSRHPWTECVEDKLWDTYNNKCVACPVGFYSINCSRTCRYPNFGYECQKECRCKQSLCDHKNGCAFAREENKTSDKKEIKDTYSTLLLVIGVSTISGFLFVFILLAVISTVNRKQYNLANQRNEQLNHLHPSSRASYERDIPIRINSSPEIDPCTGTYEHIHVSVAEA